MLPDDTAIHVIHTPTGERLHQVYPLPKRFILDAVRALYLAENERSIQSDENVKKELAAAMVAACLEPR